MKGLYQTVAARLANAKDRAECGIAAYWILVDL